jgi:hypothetical protein
LKEKAYRPSFNRLNASNDGIRNVFKFKLVAVENVSDESAAEEEAIRQHPDGLLC